MCLLPFFAFCRGDMPVNGISPKLVFLENKGQIKDQHGNDRPDIDFAVHSKGLQVFVGAGALHYQFSKLNGAPKLFNTATLHRESEQVTADMYRMDVTLIGANLQAPLVCEQPDSYQERRYVLQSAQRKITGAVEQVSKSFRKITYRNVYPQIDWVLLSRDGSLEYEFVVRPGGNPQDIRLQYGGTTALRLNTTGGLDAVTPMGLISEKAPVSYQQDGKSVRSKFVLDGSTIRFDIGSYKGTLVIDPTLTWGTYFGSTDEEIYNSVASDNVGDLYAAGYTLSISNIATLGAYQTTNAGGIDGYITKFTNGGGIVWSTYIGYTGTDYLNNIVYSNGNVYACGTSDILGDYDAFVLSLTTAGAYNAGILFGDTGIEVAQALALNASGEVYVAGTTGSPNLIATAGAHQTTYGGGTQDGLILKLAGSLSTSSLLWATYYGGSNWDAALAISVGSSGDIYVAGTTVSASGISSNTTFLNGVADGYLARFNSNGVRTWGSYIGGNGIEEIRGLTIDNAGNLVVAGHSSSTSGLATTGAYQSVNQGGATNMYDGFLARYNTSGTKLWATYNGGTGDDFLMSVTAVGSDIVVGGYTQSPTNIATSTGFQTLFGGSTDGFLTRFTNSGSRLWGTYYGGSDIDNVLAVAKTPSSEIVVAGGTLSTNGIATIGAAQTVIAGIADAFVSKITDCSLPAAPTSLTGATSVCANTTQTYSIPAIAGATNYTWQLPAGWTGSSTTNTITVTTGTTSGSIIVNANNSCGAGPSLTTSITVTPVPNGVISASGSTTLCSGNTVTLNAAPTGTGYTYQWSLNGLPIPGATNNSLLVSSGGSYTVTVSAGSGCSSTSLPVSVTVNAAPTAPVLTTNSPICAGQTLTITASTPASGATFVWSGPNGYFSTSQNVSLSNATTAASGSYSVTMTVNGCTATASTTAVVNTTPTTPTAINGPTTVCTGSTATYSVPTGTGVNSYVWTLPTGWSGNSTTNAISVTSGASGGTISVAVTNNCGSSSPQTLTVSAQAPPTPTITNSGGVLSTTSTYSSYQWYLNGSPIPGAIGQSYTYVTSGAYYVVVNNGVCDGQSNTINIALDIASQHPETRFGLYPNPNHGRFQVAGVIQQEGGDVYIDIYDVTGRRVHQQVVVVQGHELRQEIGVEHLEAGVYVVKIHGDVEEAILPFVRQ